MGIPVMVHFPMPVYQRLQHQARVMKKPVDEVVLQTVEQGTPLWMNRFPDEFEKELSGLRHLSYQQLEKIAKSKLSPKKQNRLELLLEKNAEGTLTADECNELDALHMGTSFLTLKKAKAMLLLKRQKS